MADDDVGPNELGDGGAEGAGDRGVELLGHQPADVVRLDDVGEVGRYGRTGLVGHGANPRSRVRSDRLLGPREHEVAAELGALGLPGAVVALVTGRELDRRTVRQL